MNYCPKCGTKWLSQNRFCSNCDYYIKKMTLKWLNYKLNSNKIHKTKQPNPKKGENAFKVWLMNINFPADVFFILVFWMIFIAFLSMFTAFGN